MLRLTLGRTVLAAAVLGIAAQSATAQTLTPQTQKINELIREGYSRADIKRPADRCPDTEFIRRAFIDIVGRIATPEEVLDFEKDGSPNKRLKLVQRLLHGEKYVPKASGRPSASYDYNSEFAEHWANLWGVWLMTRSTHPMYREQMQLWLEIEFLKGTNHKELVTQLLTAKGKTNENGAVNFLVYHLGEAVPAEDAGKLGKFDAVPVTSRVTRLFLGLQTQCTQCHDHPFNKEWVQSDFWGVNAFFRQTLRDRTPTPEPGSGQRMVEPVQVELSDDKGQNSLGLILYERRDGKRMASKPTFLKDLAQAEKGENSDKVIKPDMSGKTRREIMAEYVTSHDNFAKAYVNRIWGHFFGRGLNKDAPVDDFGSHNEVVHPELLDYLAEEFIKYNYDQKALMEWIATSDAYSLSHVGNKDYVDPKYDPYFARMSLKAMSPEVLFEAITVAAKSDLRGTPEQRKQFRTAFTSKLVRNFGDDEGNELSFNGTVVQALLMMNGRELNEQITGGAKGMNRPQPKGKGPAKGPNVNVAGGNAVAAVVAALGSPPRIYDELFLMALNRHPTPIEIGKLEQVRNGQAQVVMGVGPAPTPSNRPAPKGAKLPANVRIAPGAGPTDVAFYQDVFWALMNTNEFILNH